MSRGTAPGAAGAGRGGRRPAAAPTAAPHAMAMESPLDWLARRSDRQGRPMVSEVQRLAGERLRADFTRAGLTPRVTSRWTPTPAGTAGPEAFTDMVLAAKTRVSRALGAVGPELSGVLLDVCCFLKGLEEVERERTWPARTAKVVLGLALDRLAAHYRLSVQASGVPSRGVRSWHAPAPAAGEGDGAA